MNSAKANQSERIVLGLLESVERDGAQSQRRIAADLGIALGLVNSYLKRCVSKGYVKVSHVPAQRYAYYLTPNGFAEKARLTASFLMSSFEFFRQAKADCLIVYEMMRRAEMKRVVLAGRSDLAEIAIICAIESGIEVVGVIDRNHTAGRFIGVPLARDIDSSFEFDAVVITDLSNSNETFTAMQNRFGADRVFTPELVRRFISDGVAHHE